MDKGEIINWFTYHAPTQAQIGVYQQLRAEAAHFALVLNELVPECADKSAAMRKLRECVMTANAAIACDSPVEKG